MGRERFMRPPPVARHDNAMISRARAAAVGAIAATSLAGASAQAMGLVEQEPMVNEIMQGSALAFALRFDQPIDHQSSSLALVTPRGTKMLRARLDAEPNTLYSAVGELAPGEYTLRWKARGRDGQTMMGTIPFRVAP
jgi:methionine-rich copper-binding protein CopC